MKNKFKYLNRFANEHESEAVRGALPIGCFNLPNGELRTFLEDGDSVVLTALAENEGAARIGFGHVSSVVLPALESNET